MDIAEKRCITLIHIMYIGVGREPLDDLIVTINVGGIAERSKRGRPCRGEFVISARRNSSLTGNTIKKRLHGVYRRPCPPRQIVSIDGTGERTYTSRALAVQCVPADIGEKIYLRPLLCAYDNGISDGCCAD